MSYEYQESKIINVEDNQDYKVITIKHKAELFPGQFFIFWLPGYGEAAFPVLKSDTESFSIIVKKDGDLNKVLFQKKKKDNIYLRGAYGHSFPVNNIRNQNICMIGGKDFFSPLVFVFSHLKQDFIKKIFLIDKSPNSFYLEILKKNLINKNIEIQENILSLKEAFFDVLKSKSTIFLISTDENMQKEIYSILKSFEVNDKNIYFYINSKIHCGIGNCGRCSQQGHSICSDGPVFRADTISGVMKR